jgi:hypothetical protein
MRKKLLTLSVIAGLTLSVPLQVMAAEFEAAVSEQIDEQITITVVQSAVIVSGAQGELLEVVSLTGKKVLEVKVDSPSQRVELNSLKGCYILKVGKVVRKITLR